MKERRNTHGVFGISTIVQSLKVYIFQETQARQTEDPYLFRGKMAREEVSTGNINVTF